MTVIKSGGFRFRLKGVFKTPLVSCIVCNNGPRLSTLPRYLFRTTPGVGISSTIHPYIPPIISFTLTPPATEISNQLNIIISANQAPANKARIIIDRTLDDESNPKVPNSTPSLPAKISLTHPDPILCP